MVHKPLYLRVCLFVCQVFAGIITTRHYFLIKSGIVRTPGWFHTNQDSNLKNLKNIWHARVIRRFISVWIRSLFRRDILKLVDLNIQLPQNSGCVIVTCHTPWKRLLVQWCLEKQNTMIITSSLCSRKKRYIQNRALGFAELKKAMTHLHQKGQIVITVDRFNELKNCPVEFLGNYRNLCVLPVRLSRLGKVPLIMAIPVFREGVVKFIRGPYLNPNLNKSDPFAIMKNLIYYLENEIEKDPSIWPEYVG